jgi:RNA polymerase sigma factor (sigma-70 family)
MEVMAMGFDNTIDSRWRPDLESSRRRVREELADEDEPPVRYSRELSFVPARRPEFAACDAQTRALIAQYERLEKLPHGERLSPLLEEWRWIDAMKSPEEEQRYVEPMIEAVRRDPAGHECELIFLLLVFEPVRRKVSKLFMRARAGLAAPKGDVDWGDRAEARMIREIEKQALYDVTRAGAIEAIFRYPTPPPKTFFPWLCETIAYRTLDHLRDELAQTETRQENAEEALALQAALGGFDPDPPTMRDRAGMREWRARIHMRDVFEVVDDYYEESAIANVCRAAVGRLAPGQRQVIEGYYYEGSDVPHLAARRGVSESTIYNTKVQAEARLHADDGFFSALHQLGLVRDRARALALQARYPDGRHPDGRRVVIIEPAA